MNHETFCHYRLVCCRFAHHGCPTESTYKEIQQHHKICTYNPDIMRAAAAAAASASSTAPTSNSASED